MRCALLGLALGLSIGSATVARADPQYSDPYAEPRHGLRFADLEASVGKDPRLWSTDPRWDAHHTPPAMLVRASQALHAAVPAGTPAPSAAAVLEKAGARCAGAGPSELDCIYHDVETPFSGADFDNITWHVKLALAEGRVNNLGLRQIERGMTGHASQDMMGCGAPGPTSKSLELTPFGTVGFQPRRFTRLQLPRLVAIAASQRSATCAMG